MLTILRVVLPVVGAVLLLGCKGEAGAGAEPESAAPAPPSPAELAAPPADAQVTPSKLAFKVLRPGEGPPPGPADEVELHYTGYQRDGTMIFSTKKIGRPAKALVRRLSPGLSQGLQLMNVGAKVRLWIPEALADEGRGGDVVYDVELVNVVRGVGAPEDVAAPPADAAKTASGLAYIVLKAGDGTTRPQPGSSVTVHYTGWTTDGERFDSTRTKGAPATLPLSTVIPGWREGLPLMDVGAQYRFWIPEALAYQGRRPPHGMLVFDVELLEVK